jgi:hypothetical protein
MTFGGIDGKINEEPSDKDCILLWDNVFCLENPSMLQMIKEKRTAEFLKSGHCVHLRHFNYK